MNTVEALFLAAAAAVVAYLMGGAAGMKLGYLEGLKDLDEALKEAERSLKQRKSQANKQASRKLANRGETK